MTLTIDMTRPRACTRCGWSLPPWASGRIGACPLCILNACGINVRIECNTGGDLSSSRTYRTVRLEPEDDGSITAVVQRENVS